MDPVWVVSVGVASFAFAALVHRRRSHALHGVAERRGFEVEGHWMRGEVQGVAVEASVRFSRRGRLEGLRPTLVVAAAFPVELDLGLSVATVRGDRPLLEGRRVSFGSLDARFEVHGDEEARVRRLFGEEVRAALHRLPAATDLRLDDRGLVLSTARLDEGSLEATVERAGALAAAIDARRASVDVAVAVAHLEARWRHLADQLHLHLETCPLGIRPASGPGLFGHTCRQRARRLGVRIGLELAEPLWPGLTAHPTDERDALDEAWGAELILDGAPPLRLVHDEERLEADLVAALRRARDELGPLRVDGSRLSVRRDTPPEHPEEILAVAHALGELAERFGAHPPRHVPSAYRGVTR